MPTRLFALLLAVLPACGPADRADDGHRQATTTPGKLLERATDRSLEMGDRLSAAQALLSSPGGAARLAGATGSSGPDGRALLDTLLVRDPRTGVRLAAEMMAAAEGEAKLDFEVLLLGLGDLAVEPLMGLLGTGRHWQTEVRALDALGKLRAHVAVDTVASALRRPNTWVRMAAAHALGDIGGPAVVGPLSQALRDTARTVVVAALIGLGRTGLPQAADICAQQLSHSDPRVRAAAVSALGRLGGPVARDRLRPMRQDPDAGVRYKAQRALERLEASP